MNSTAGRIRQIEDELAGLPAGYISKKMIHGKERFYLQWMENGKLKSRLNSMRFQRRWKDGSSCRRNGKP